jgi:hypothetical protein
MRGEAYSVGFRVTRAILIVTLLANGSSTLAQEERFFQGYSLL